MSDDNGLHEKASASLEVLTSTVTDDIYRKTQEVGSHINVMHWLVQISDALIPAWWSRRRDLALRNLSTQSDFFQGAKYKIAAKLTDVPLKVVPRDPSIKSHRKQAEEYTGALIEGSELGQGWGTFLPKFLDDLWTQDNGAFAEIIGDGPPDGPIRGPALGLKVLSSARCTRTSNPIYPVIYNAYNGTRYKFHYTRIINTSQMPDTDELMFGIGHCWLSRCVNTVQNLVDIGIFKQEKLGSRPQRKMIVGKGVEALEIWEAFRRAEMQMDAQGLKRYAKNVVIGGLTKDDSIDSIDLTSANDLSDERVMTDIGVFVLAMTGGFPPRWIWPATTTGATKADGESQHLAGISSGGQVLHDLEYMLGGTSTGLKHSAGKFLPPHLKLVFDYQDDQQDRQQAENRNIRSQVWDRDIKAGLLTTRVAREQMLDVGDITESQFEDLELTDGRLADGQPAETLLYTDDPVYRSIFGDIDPVRPDMDAVASSLNIARYIAANPDNVAQQRAADTAAKVLEYLLGKAKSVLLEQAQFQAVQTEEEETEESEEELETKERSGFRLALVRNVQLLWDGTNTPYQFAGAMEQAIRNEFRNAWAEGAKMCGIDITELTPEEEIELQNQIAANISRLTDFAEYIEEHSKSNGYTLNTVMSRANMWLNSYDRVSEIAKSYACSDQKMIWILGSVEEHCKDCLRFGGKVYRMSMWNKIGILPKSLALACHGYRCDCRLVPTNKSLSRGRPLKFTAKELELS